MRSYWIQNKLNSINDIDFEGLELNGLQKAQIHAAHTRQTYINHEALARFLSVDVQGPITYIDFEWDTFAQPPYAGMHPFDVVVFQFSLHILTQEELIHHEFLGSQDCREAFLEALFKALPEHGQIFAYNAFGAEVLRLKELAQIYPQWAPKIEATRQRFKDLAEVFNQGIVYDPRMKGSLTLKRIHQVIQPTSSYTDLRIAHGLDAVYHYRNLDETQDELRQALLAYGKMDTQAMVDVYLWLERLQSQHA